MTRWEYCLVIARLAAWEGDDGGEKNHLPVGFDGDMGDMCVT